MKSVLVAGGAGYIGSHTVKELRRAGFRPVVFDNLSSGHRDAVGGADFVEGDLRDPVAIGRVLKTGDIAAVLHFASLIQVGESYVNPRKYYLQNLLTALNLLEATLEAGVRGFIFSSSAAVYGLPRETPLREDHPVDPINPYGRTKAMVEEILRDYDRAYGLRYVSLRYFNAAGADPEGELGERHDPETHLIPNVLRAVSGHGPALSVFGTDFPTPDGTAIRDYIHVTDLAAAHVLALRHLLEGGGSEIINLGTNRGYSVLEVVAAAEKIAGRPVPREEKPRREGDPPVLLASKEKAERVLGWKLRFSDLGTILETAWAWHRRGR
ncbi:MAG: UDP-glucose 4-epimerase GalE [Candidatus Aminicenantes bacterium]|nr:UDP-glucose 4-epimerase GalE [Candidatus Aminicenantes bacterium]